MAGGKFSNDALTGTYVAMYNHMQHDGDEGKRAAKHTSKLSRDKDVVEVDVNRIVETDQSTITEFTARSPLRPSLKGYFLEPAGPSSMVSGSDLRIMPGRYLVESYNSIKHPGVFQITDVPGRNSILIHTGNIPAHTEGCFLPGFSYGTNRVNDSKNAFNSIKTYFNNNGGDSIFFNIFGN